MYGRRVCFEKVEKSNDSNQQCLQGPVYFVMIKDAGGFVIDGWNGASSVVQIMENFNETSSLERSETSSVRVVSTETTETDTSTG